MLKFACDIVVVIYTRRTTTRNRSSNLSCVRVEMHAPTPCRVNGQPICTPRGYLLESFGLDSFDLDSFDLVLFGDLLRLILFNLDVDRLRTGLLELRRLR